MVNSQVLSYLRKHKDAHGVDALRNQMIKGGYSIKDVDEAINVINSENVATLKNNNSQENGNKRNFEKSNEEMPIKKSDRSTREIKKRNIFLIYLFTLLTFGIYWIYWVVVTKKDMNSKGSNIPPAIFAFIPFSNIFFFFYYYRGFKEVTKKEKLSNMLYLFYLSPLIVSIVISVNKIIQLISNPLSLMTLQQDSLSYGTLTIVFVVVTYILMYSILGFTQYQINKLSNNS